MFAIFLSFCIFMQNRGRKRSRFNILASFTKHVCKPNPHHLKIVNMPFRKRNMPFRKRKHGT